MPALTFGRRLILNVGVAKLKIRGRIVKILARHISLSLLISLGLCGCRTSAPTELIGITRAELIAQLGEPTQIVDATHEYPDQGLSVIVLDEKVIQYTIKQGSNRQTPLGVKIGTPMTEVTRLYGNYTAEEEVEKWFTGDAPHVLYHHGEFDKYKINYPDKNLIFIFDEKKLVESIWFGFPPTNSK